MFRLKWVKPKFTILKMFIHFITLFYNVCCLVLALVRSFLDLCSSKREEAFGNSFSYLF